MSDKEISISVPLTDLIEQIWPHLEIKMEHRFAEAKLSDNRRRSKLDALTLAVDAVVKAVQRVDQARGTRDEIPSMTALIAAANGLRNARLNYQKGS